ncbi:peptidylprolyl isomerase [Thermoflexibacter ruber]|uniref:Periplasmic chaperone for outer membrane proteins SurA n=1 Tax=Thermoflexibacter ruber TaxID=1003 RepID=A0A1I2H2K3_9BACT|nr:peptidylprolyl isomerase [Thermoflexibacter ruber]SFF23630.1 periplasmic chaperone for outer membrane proteins SurA [Thermoflexibacter ruber]
MKKFVAYSITLFMMLFVKQLTAQNVVIDKIVGRVNNEIILKSDLEKMYQQVLEQEKNLPPNIYCYLLQQLIVNKVLVAKAEIDSVEVDNGRVELELDRRMDYFIGQFGDKEKLEKTLGKTTSMLKEELRDQIKEQLTVQTMRKKITDEAKITPRQVKKFFAEIPKDSLPFLPAEVEVGQIVRFPKVSKSEKDKAKAQLLDFKKQILNGVDFEELASKYSEDLGSAGRGGDLGWHGRGELVPPFEAAVFSLEPMQISEPVESEFGIHLIQLLERQGNRHRSRHILIRPKPTPQDIQDARNFLDSIRTLIKKDSIKFVDAVHQFSDDKATKAKEGMIHNPENGETKIPVDNTELLGFGVYMTLEKMKVGEISEVIEFRTNDEKQALRILYYKTRIPPHYMNLKDDWQKITQLAQEDQKAELLMKWFEKAKKEVFIDIDEEFDYCNLLKNL